MDQYQQEFIKNLKKCRKKRGLSQEKLAELCNVSTGTIENIECGIGKPSFDLLITMANVLGIHPARLLHDEASPDHRKEQSEAGTELAALAGSSISAVDAAFSVSHPDMKTGRIPCAFLARSSK